MTVRNRIKAHVKVRAGDLVPHPLNFHEHPSDQREALAASYEEIGFARSLLAYELPDGRYQLIDGHLRASMDPDMLVDLEVLDVTEEEARQLLLTLDPLVRLAQTNAAMHARLCKQTATRSPALAELRRRTAAGLSRARAEALARKSAQTLTERYLVLVECADEDEQVELLARFQGEGLRCKALLS